MIFHGFPMGNLQLFPWETHGPIGKFRLGPFLDLPQLALQENGLALENPIGFSG